MQTFRFYKEEGKWYVDLPEFIQAGGDKAALEMVFGADEFLSNNCVIGKDEVVMDIATSANADNWDARMSKLVKASNKLESGAFYIVQGNIHEPSHVMWLCDVMEYVFGKFPDVIYFLVK